MSNIYTWDINSLDTVAYLQDKENVVFRVTWSLTATDGINSASLSYFTEIEYDPDTSFTPYEDLTKDQVLEWVSGVMNEEESSKWKATIDAHLLTLSNKTEERLPPPWA